ncbi:MAG: hypothetical protein ABJ242_03425 [Marinomonas sp.]
MIGNVIREGLSFARWRLAPVRYLERLPRLNLENIRTLPAPQLEVNKRIEKEGITVGPTLLPSQVEELRELFLPRLDTATKTARKHPFVNLTNESDLTSDNPLIRAAFSKDVLDVAIDYFGGRATLNSLQALYSFAGNGDARMESQKWHLDYSDTRSLHWVVYLNDVSDAGAGAFVCHSKEVSKKVGRSLIIRRIDDAQMAKETGGAEPNVFYGEAGASVILDPAAVYHFGSRCTVPRLALFVTFNSDAPFNNPTPLVHNNSARIARVMREVRPDLSDETVNRLLMQ